MPVTSISRKLLTRVLSLYFTLTIIVTGVQIGAEYLNTKSHIKNELLTLEQTFSGSLTRAIWELNTQQAIDIAQGLVAIPSIKGISITNESSEVIVQLGDVFQKAESVNSKQYDTAVGKPEMDIISGNNFGHTFPLIFEFSGRTTQVGMVTLLSNNSVVFDRIQVGLYFLVGNAMVKTAALVFLFTLAFAKLLTAPLNELTAQIERFDPEDPEESKLHTLTYERNELNILQDAYNSLLDELAMHKQKLFEAQTEIISTNNKLDEQNLILEQEVARKTSSLSSTMLKMERQKKELLEQQGKLEAENSRRSLTENTLTQSNKDLKSSIIELNETKNRLLAADKMVVLGNLSVAISREVDTPIGISVTSIGYLNDLFSRLSEDIKGEALSKKAMEDFVSKAQQSVKLLEENLARSSGLISSFKQISADQVSDKIRKVNIEMYVNEVIKSLSPILEKTNHTIKVDCPENIELYVHAGAIAQIFTNLIINSVVHGFEYMQSGVIFISINIYNDRLHIRFQDNGIGIETDKISQLFDANFTSQANGSVGGLGTHIVKSLVTDTLNGTIEVDSRTNGGLCYDIEFNNMQ